MAGRNKKIVAKVLRILLGIALFLFLLWKRPVTVPIREGAAEVMLHYRGQAVLLEDKERVEFLEENLRKDGIVRKLLWPSTGERFEITFFYEDGTSEIFVLNSASHLTGRIGCGSWRSSGFRIIYSSNEPVYQEVYDWLNEVYGVESG